jgi:hypothetical protein
MLHAKVKELFPADVFDLAFIDRNADDFPKELIPFVDLANTGDQSAVLPVVSETRGGLSKGRPATENQTEIERQIKGALDVATLRSYFGLLGLGYTPTRAEEYVTKELSGCVRAFSTMIKDGKIECVNFLNVASWRVLKERDMLKFRKEALTKKKEMARAECLSFIQPLARAYNRTSRVYSDEYKDNNCIRDKKRKYEVEKAYTYKNDAEKPICATDCLIASLTTYINPIEIWQSYAYCRHIFNSAIPIGLMASGKNADFFLIDLYILFRLLESDTPITPAAQDGTPHGASGCQCLLRNYVENMLGVGSFLEQASGVLNTYGLLQDRPKTTAELETRCLFLVDKI